MLRMVGAALAVLAIGCGEPVRGEVVLWIDTDVRVPRHADTLKIEVFDGTSFAHIETRELTLATPDRWPVSLGLGATDETSAPIFRLRVTAYPAPARMVPVPEPAVPAALYPPACPDGVVPDEQEPAAVQVEGPVDAPIPLPQFSTSRLVEVAVAPGEVVGRSVVLTATCLASIPDAAADTITCVDGVDGAPTDGLASADPDDAPESNVGTARLLEETPCEVPDTAGLDGRVCVKGGLGYLGDLGAVDIVPTHPAQNDTPPVPVRVEPFSIDRFEVTVGRLWDAMNDPDPAGRFTPSSGDLLPYEGDQSSPEPLRHCTWPGDSPPDAATRAQPAVCVTWRLAEEFCAWAGGSLPSEAQWLFVATGRGQDTKYPWGFEWPKCFQVSAGLYDLGECGVVEEIPAVDAFMFDATPEGVIGLAGSVMEIMADRPGALARRGCRAPRARGLGLFGFVGEPQSDEACACAGVFVVPEIESDHVREQSRVLRGSAWATAPLPRRRGVVHGAMSNVGTPGEIASVIGFRCVYPATGAP